MFRNEQLSRIEHKLNELIFKVNILMATMQDLTAEVASETTVNQSIVTLLDGIAAQLTAANAANDPAAIANVITSLQANSKILTDAITANTPVTPVVASSTPAQVTVVATPTA